LVEGMLADRPIAGPWMPGKITGTFTVTVYLVPFFVIDAR
jgi:hypothetical protein